MEDWDFVQQQQKDLCSRLKAVWTPVELKSLIAFNESIFTSIQPLNGLRHQTEGIIDGWYLWSGAEIPQNDIEFFKPLHVEYFFGKRQIVLKYLGLPAGWRFQIDDYGYEDIWYDPSILKI